VSGERDSFVVEGRTFTVPSPVAGVRVDERLAIAFYAGGSVRKGRDVIRYSLAPAAVDLSRVRANRAPLLVEHTRSVDALIGATVAAEADGVFLRSLVRFARGREADRLYEMLCSGFALSLSMGCQILAAERTGDDPDGPGGIYVVMRWRLEELSVVVFGREEEAHLRRPDPGEDAAAMLARLRGADAGDPAREAIRHVLHLDRWEAWARLTGPKLAVELGLEADPVPVCDALEREVAEHCGRLERDLAA
jgi:hypothetical protein